MKIFNLEQQSYHEKDDLETLQLKWHLNEL